jgi:hypothetical protein
MPQQLESLGILLGENSHCGIGLEGTIQVPDLPVDPRGKRGSCEPRPDPLGNLPRSRTGGRLTLTPIRERHLDCGHRGDSSTDGGTAGLVDGAKYRKSTIPAMMSAATTIQRNSSDPPSDTWSFSMSIPRVGNLPVFIPEKG